MAANEEYEYYEEEEYEEYEEYVYGDGNDEEHWYYDETEETLTSPPKKVIEILSTQYSQQLFIDVSDLKVDDVDDDNNDEHKDDDSHNLNIDSFSCQRSRDRSRHKKSNLKSKQSPHMMAINVIKGLFKNERLNELQESLNGEELEGISRILESIISRSSSIPEFIINLFYKSMDNMFGTLNIDFNLLNNDYLYIKSVFVDGGESNNSSIKFERIMKLITNGKISTIQISNIHLTQKSFDCIINYIANDDNYDQENYLENSVNQIILHRKSGLKYNAISTIYSEQFNVCGWKMSFDEKKQFVIIHLNFTASWQYIYDEDYDEDEDEEENDEKIDVPPSIPSAPSAPKKQTIGNDDGYEYYYEDENGNTMTGKNNEEDEYEYYYEDENGNAMTENTTNNATTNGVILSDISRPRQTSTIMDIESGVGGIGGDGLLGLPPPDDDEESDNNIDSEFNKIKFLTEVLTKKDYEGKILFNGMLKEIIDCMQRMDVKKNQCIIRETEYGQNYDLKFFVIEYGVFNLYQQGKKLGIELFSTSTFGETHLIYGIPQYVTIKAATNKCLVWYLNASLYYQISWKYFHKAFKNRLATKLNEFNIITTLGIGSFGKVLLVRDKYNQKKTYSLKKISKNNVIQNKQQRHIMNERSVMALISKPKLLNNTNNNAENKNNKKQKQENTFCCKLFGLYQDSYYLYFLMEPLLGGELFTLLRHNKCFSEKVARFYLSCIIIAFDHLHSLNIIYRDIKPENIMLCSNGYCKLVDFGLSKLRNNTVTCCGTPEYLAPEVIQNYWQGFELDFWGLGILLFEMITGKPPFDSYQQILTSNVPTTISSVSNECINLINNLLIKHPYQRLGTTANKRKGINEIYQHEWFKDKMEWNALKAQRFRPPYIPSIDDDEDASNFEDCDDDNDDEKELFIKNNYETLYDDKSLYKWCQYF